MCVGWVAILIMKVTGPLTLPSKPTKPQALCTPCAKRREGREGKDVKRPGFLFEFLPPKKPIRLDKIAITFGCATPMGKESVGDNTTSRLSKIRIKVLLGLEGGQRMPKTRKLRRRRRRSP